MANSKIFKNFFITRRQLLLSAFKTTCFGIIASRLGYLQLFKHEKYSLMSKKNSISTIPIPPIRGEILDRHGYKIAFDRQLFKLVLYRPFSKISSASLLKLFTILAISPKDQETIKLKIRNKPFKPTIIEQLSWDQIVLIEQNIGDLENFHIYSYFSRCYPNSNALAHPIGYTYQNSQKNILHNNPQIIENSISGKTGIEKYYNEQLKGNFGFKNIEVDAYGNNLRELDFMSSIKGGDLILNLDMNIQNKICHVLKDTSSSAIVYDVKNHQLVACVSMPNFHTEYFVNGLSQKYWNSLHSDEKLPLLNKTMQATYPPGSIFKLVTCLAALNQGLDPKTLFLCKSRGFLADHFHCWNKQGHGLLNMEQAIGRSCNYYMYNIVKIIGHKAIIEMAKLLGFGTKVGIDLPDEVSGFLPNIDKIKNWTFASSLNIAIGQGPLSASPLQLNKLISIIATKGCLPQYLLAKTSNTDRTMTYLNINQAHFDVLRRGMWQSVNNPSGTGYNAKSFLQIAGKTATAQVQSKKKITDDFNLATVNWKYRNHGIFGCFAPFDVPQYAISVVVEHGGGGGASAAPIAKKIAELLTYF